MSRARNVANLGADTTNLEDISSAYSAGALSNRNKIINGAMTIDQRNAGAAVTVSGSYVVDRFSVINSTDGAFSAQQVSEAPSGFTKSVKVTATTADATLTGAQNLHLRHAVEGFNVADLGWGTAAAQAITISFWVRSSLTGTFGGSLRNSASNRTYAFTYSVSAANTWEYKTVTIAGDTTGTWLSDNGVGILVSWGLGAGPDRSGTPGVWTGDIYVSAAGAVSLIGTLNATWQITGVQLEAGDTATPFEHRSYGQELALCRRYFKWLPPLQGNFIVGGSSVFIAGMGNTLTDMRASPTFTLVNGAGAVHVSNVANIDVNSLNDTNFNYCRVNTASSPGAYAGGHFNAGNLISLSAEL